MWLQKTLHRWIGGNHREDGLDLIYVKFLNFKLQCSKVEKIILGGCIMLLTVVGILKLGTLVSGGNTIEASIRWLEWRIGLNVLHYSMFGEIFCYKRKNSPRASVGTWNSTHFGR